MTWKLHRKGYENAKSLIEAGKINDGEWEKPDLKDFNDVEEYALFHLAVNPDADPSTAGAYAYPYGREGEVYIQALRAIRASAAGARGATRNDEIFNAAGGLLEMIDEKTEKCQGQCIQQNMIIKVDKHQRIVTGPVLVPDEYDLDGDILTKDQIEEVAYNFMENYQNIDILHRFKNVAKPVESFILREDTVIGDVELPEGTWILSAKVYDDDTWKGIVQGKYQGFSITAIPAAMKKTTLEDIGWPFEVVTVSIVDRPAVPKARYLSIKGGGDKMDEKSVLKSIFQTLKGYFESEEESRESPEDDGIKEEVETLKSEIKTLKSEISELKEAQPTSPEESEDEGANDTDETSNDGDEEEIPESQAMKGQIGGCKATKSMRELLAEEIGVDSFGRPLN